MLAIQPPTLEIMMFKVKKTKPNQTICFSGVAVGFRAGLRTPTNPLDNHEWQGVIAGEPPQAQGLWQRLDSNQGR